MSPESGNALEKIFSLSAEEGWSDDDEDLPLSYTFGFYAKDTSGEVKQYSFASQSETYKQNVQFPPGTCVTFLL